MSANRESYIEKREKLLQAVAERLSSAEPFAAAWLTGSFARGQADTLSDIDITVVVTGEHSPVLCARPSMVSAKPTQERYDLFRLFGKPSLLHENHHNAPEGGTFTFVAYEQNALLVDWVLRPLTGAPRPPGALLLFDKAGIPVQPPAAPESQEQRAEEAAERMAFFWMMAAVTVKYIDRQDGVFVNSWLEGLANLVAEVERRTRAQPWQYHRGSRTRLSSTPAEQIAALRRLCRQMENLGPEVAKLGGHVPESPMETIETLIAMVQEKAGLTAQEG